MSFPHLPLYVEDLIEERAGVWPAVLFGAGSSGAVSMLFTKRVESVLLSALFGGMMGAAFALAVEHASESKAGRVLAEAAPLAGARMQMRRQ